MRNWLDNLIAFVSPAWGYRRAAWRNALGVRTYDGADTGRLNAGWHAVSGTAEQADQGARDRVRVRARDLERNSDVLEAIIRAFERNVVGTGFRLQARPRRADGTVDQELAQRIELLWDAWQKPFNCDISSQQSFGELCRMAVRRMLVDGGMLFVKNYVGGPQMLPFQLQAREVDDLDATLGNRTANGNLLVGGVELNAYNRPVAYHLRTTSADGYWTGASERIEAQRIVFLWDKRRPSQVREMSRLAPTITRVRDITSYLEAVGVKERVAACLAVAITQQSPAGTVGRGLSTVTQSVDTDSGFYGDTITPGMIYRLAPGEDVRTITPPGSGSGAREFVALQQRLAGGGQGISYETASRDMSEVNYSSARQGRLEDQAEYDVMAQFLIDHLLDEVYREFVISAVLAGKLDAPGFWDNKPQYMDHQFMAPGMAWIDPLKEVKADAEAVRSNQDTLANLCARRGQDWREILEQRGRERALEEALGIVPRTSVSVNPPADGG